MLTINNIIEKANEEFKVVAKEKVTDNLIITEFHIETSDAGLMYKIPIISEWTCGANNVLVFNQMNSCLGLIAISNDSRFISGTHFSLSEKFMPVTGHTGADEKEVEALKSELGAIIEAYVSAIKSVGYVNVTAFGGSVSEWNKYTNSILEKLEIPTLDNDINDKKWYFAVDQGSWMLEYWPKEEKKTEEEKEKTDEPED